MAASSAAGRVLTLCRQFQNVCRISSTITVQHCAVNVTKGQNHVYGGLSPLVALPQCSPISSVGQCRALHTTISRRGLEEFFDFPENWGETNVKSGAPWTAKQLRTKSNEDLHKLWYVLLKEKNMLLTLQQEAKRQRVQMPSPERIRKIERSMFRLETVVNERETALRLLQTGQEKGRPGAWRRNIFGHVYWYRFKEYAIPWYMNKRYKRKRFFTPKFVQPHIRLRIEKHLRDKARKANLKENTQAKLMDKFPRMKVSSS
ncbi:39S ribosomal protein L47, mitochondrial [Seriola lalandi dorsalis]|uniref:Large ribosomal subunit protein uL29m n=1 Tax=Seriola lalandi dorsalis TaxID=1841481 RepID=A0A3B4Y0J5_SERLL|nr:39S ribosomal protein L47, mitochondrial [Seriola lalandi dorsalis]XP_056233967.1 39S ribosomal protein L47, mitochondrial [Seriola aureovittata]